MSRSACTTIKNKKNCKFPCKLITRTTSNGKKRHCATIFKRKSKKKNKVSIKKQKKRKTKTNVTLPKVISEKVKPIHSEYANNNAIDYFNIDKLSSQKQENFEEENIPLRRNLENIEHTNIKDYNDKNNDYDKLDDFHETDNETDSKKSIIKNDEAQDNIKKENKQQNSVLNSFNTSFQSIQNSLNNLDDPIKDIMQKQVKTI